MIKNKIGNISKYLSEIAVQGISDKKGNDIVRLDLTNIHSSVADYFVICHADSGVQVRAICDNVEKEIYEKTQTEPWRKEGLQGGEWIILDYIDTVVHIFKTEKRKFYGIEELWGDAEATTYQSA